MAVEPDHRAVAFGDRSQLSLVRQELLVDRADVRDRRRNDPDGNGWLFQEVTARLPGRVEGDTTFGSAAELAIALRRAANAHGEHEKRTGKPDPDWPDWYAEYMVREQDGGQPPP